MHTFEALGLQDHLLQAISDLGFETPSEVQQETIPTLLKQDTDIVSLAQTGTGKTAAFGFPMLQKINTETRHTQGLIVAPTRELCLQITQEMQHYGKYCNGLNIVAIYGGANIQEQAKKVSRGAQIIVATPGRLKDMIGRKWVNVSSISYCVLDEADEMLNMGFYDDIVEILSHTPKSKATWLFSATMPKEVARIAKEFMDNPIEVTVGAKNTGAKNVSHEYYLVNARDRYLALKRLADANPDIFSVVFCRTKRDTQKVAEQLIEDGYNAGALHGDLSQHQRDLVMKSFRNKQIQMLVATDVAARGIDVDDITHVINYQLPDEIETYTHRSGRTGRAGKTGVSMILVSKSELRKIKTIARIINKDLVAKTLPSGMEICEIQLLHLARKVEATEEDPNIAPYIEQLNTLFEPFSKETLIKKIFSVEFSRFHKYYQSAKDITAEAPSGGSTSSAGNTRFFINLGRKDGFSWMTLKDFLRDLMHLQKDDLFKVDVMNTYSFFNVEDHCKELVFKTFKTFNWEGRKITVEETQERSYKPRDKKKRTKSRTTQSKPYASKKTNHFKDKGTGGRRRRR